MRSIAIYLAVCAVAICTLVYVAMASADCFRDGGVPVRGIISIECVAKGK